MSPVTPVRLENLDHLTELSTTQEEIREWRRQCPAPLAISSTSPSQGGTRRLTLPSPSTRVSEPTDTPLSARFAVTPPDTVSAPAGSVTSPDGFRMPRPVSTPNLGSGRPGHSRHPGVMRRLQRPGSA